MRQNANHEANHKEDRRRALRIRSALPLLVISPYAKQNYVDHTLTDQSSVLRFIEDNWHLGRIGGGSFDEKAGTIENMFNFKRPAKAPKPSSTPPQENRFLNCVTLLAESRASSTLSF